MAGTPVQGATAPGALNSEWATKNERASVLRQRVSQPTIPGVPFSDIRCSFAQIELHRRLGFAPSGSTPLSASGVHTNWFLRARERRAPRVARTCSSNRQIVRAVPPGRLIPSRRRQLSRSFGVVKGKRRQQEKRAKMLPACRWRSYDRERDGCRHLFTYEQSTLCRSARPSLLPSFPSTPSCFATCRGSLVFARRKPHGGRTPAAWSWLFPLAREFVLNWKGGWNR